MENNNEVKRTQGEWKCEWTHSENNIKKGWHIIINNYSDVINIPNAPEAEANAAFICKAVNEYDSLIEDNKRLLELNKELQNTLDYMKEKLYESAFKNINKAENKL